MKKNGVGMWAGLGLWVAAVGMVCAAEPGKSTGASKPTLTVTVTSPQTASLAQKISANGSLTGYAGGLNRKLWLLQHELQYANA